MDPEMSDPNAPSLKKKKNPKWVDSMATKPEHSFKHENMRILLEMPTTQIIVYSGPSLLPTVFSSDELMSCKALQFEAEGTYPHKAVWASLGPSRQLGSFLGLKAQGLICTALKLSCLLLS